MALRLDLDPSGIITGAAKAETALDALVAQSKVAQAGFVQLGDSGKELDRIKRAYDPASAAGAKLINEVNDLNATMKAGAITAQQYAANVSRIEASALPASAAMQMTSVAAIKTGGTMSSMAYQSRMMGMQLSQVAQQTMVTGNFMQALAVQLPDLGLGFGVVGMAAGVIAGIALPLLWPALSPPFRC